MLQGCGLLAGTSLAAEPVTILDDGETSIHLWESTCNNDVIRRGDRAILIDLGDASVLAKMDAVGVPRPDWVLFTGHHRERVQGVESLDRSHTRLAAPEAERALFEDPLSFRNWFPTLGDRYTVYGASYVRPPRFPVPIDHPLTDEERFSWAGLEVRCRATPGNSPGGLTYVVEVGGQQVAFTGGLIHAGAKMVTWFDTEWDYGFRSRPRPPCPGSVASPNISTNLATPNGAGTSPSSYPKTAEA